MTDMEKMKLVEALFVIHEHFGVDGISCFEIGHETALGGTPVRTTGALCTIEIPTVCRSPKDTRFRTLSPWPHSVPLSPIRRICSFSIWPESGSKGRKHFSG